jgi:hypothetical protein
MPSLWLVILITSTGGGGGGDNRWQEETWNRRGIDISPHSIQIAASVTVWLSYIGRSVIND